jgi:hypothetical protein
MIFVFIIQFNYNVCEKSGKSWELKAVIIAKNNKNTIPGKGFIHEKSGA